MGKEKSPALGSGALSQDKTTTKNSVPVFPGNVNGALQTAFQNLLTEADGLNHGILKLEIHVRNGSPYRHTVTREVSFLCGKEE